MKCFLSMGFIAAGFVLGTSLAEAQVSVRAPFVRVQVGGPGVYVRAPFVNIFVPSNPPVYVLPPQGPVFIPPPPRPVDNMPPAEGQPLPKADPKRQPENPDLDPPQPLTPAKPLTMQEFAKSFQPKAGSYEITILSPVTKEPTPVRFTLPEGTPKRINVNGRSIEFQYGPRQFVRIEFDRDGALITSR